MKRCFRSFPHSSGTFPELPHHVDVGLSASLDHCVGDHARQVRIGFTGHSSIGAFNLARVNGAKSGREWAGASLLSGGGGLSNVGC